MNTRLRKASISALIQFTSKEFYCGVGAKESLKNITGSLVTIVTQKDNPNEGNLATGQLITKDGWIITANHYVTKDLQAWKKAAENKHKNHLDCHYWLNSIIDHHYILTQQNKRFPIDVAYYFPCKEYDLALIKAVLPYEPEAIRIKPYFWDLKVNDKIGLIRFNNRRSQDGFTLIDPCLKRTPYGQEGVIIFNTITIKREDYNLNDAFLAHLPGEEGCSGSPITTLAGELVGMWLFRWLFMKTKSLQIFLEEQK